MLNGMYLAGEPVIRKRSLQVIFGTGPCSLVPDSVQHHPEIRTVAEHVLQPRSDVRLDILIDRDSIHLGEADAGFGEAVPDCLARAPRPVFDTSEALFLSGGEHHAVAND